MDCQTCGQRIELKEVEKYISFKNNDIKIFIYIGRYFQEFETLMESYIAGFKYLNKSIFPQKPVKYLVATQEYMLRYDRLILDQDINDLETFKIKLLQRFNETRITSYLYIQVTKEDDLNLKEAIFKYYFNMIDINEFNKILNNVTNYKIEHVHH